MPRTAKTARRTRIGAAALVVLAGAVTVPSTQAIASAAPGQGEARAKARHCTSDLSTGKQKCYRSFAAAIEAASGGRIDDAPASARAAAGDEDFRAATEKLAASHAALADGQVIQGTFFDKKQFGGDSMTVVGEKPCEKDGWVNFQFNFPDGWKNRVSSVQGWANCSLWLYPGPDLGGERDGPFDRVVPDIGATMNDRTQSVGFS